MSLFNAIFGRKEPTPPPGPPDQGTGPNLDEQALERYRYLLRTAPPDAIEQVHAETFARLTPEQRAQVLQKVASAVPPHESRPLQDDPQALARVATRAEMREPGFLERTLGGGGLGAGAVVLGPSLLGSFLVSMAGSMLAHQLLAGFDAHGGAFESPYAAQEDESDEDDEEEAESDDTDADTDDGGFDV